MISNLAFALANLTFAATILAVIGVAAAGIRPFVARPEEPPGAATALAFSAGGFGLIIFLFASAGWIGWRLWWVVAALVHLGIAGGLALAARRLSPPQRQQSRDWLRMAPTIVFLVWVVAFDLLKCFEPRFETDAIWYHLTLPKFWLEAGGLRAHPTMAVAGYPLLIEMIYMAPVSYGLPFATRVIHLAFAVGVAIAIYGWLRGGTGVSAVKNQLSPAYAIVFAAAFFLFDSVNEAAAWAHTDLARAFFLICAAASLAAYVDRGERRDLVIAAAVAGLAMSTHYMAIIFGNGLLTIALIAARIHRGQVGGAAPPRSETIRRLAREIAIFWLVSLAVFAPWLLKNIIHYGRPLHGLVGTNFRLPSGEVLSRFFLGNVFFVGFAFLALWWPTRRECEPGERLLAFYLIGYFVVGAFEIPPIIRFFLPVYALGLMLAGRAVAPFLNARRWLEVPLAVALLAIGIAITGYQWRHHLYDEPVRFLLHNKPPAMTIHWHR